MVKDLLAQSAPSDRARDTAVRTTQCKHIEFRICCQCLAQCLAQHNECFVPDLLATLVWLFERLQFRHPDVEVTKPLPASLRQSSHREHSRKARQSKAYRPANSANLCFEINNCPFT